MGISLLGFAASLLVILAVCVLLCVVAVVMKCTDMKQADISVGLKGLSIHMTQHPRPDPPNGRRKRGKGAQ
ncbi:hypothetical protein [Mycobacteroides abscessus]|uniref:hypothetical protein n=1 Tax=Mycobacteroides abscessus TaxID=36809 RepID=UPI000928C446|nr:hypothetical protein [Mycobacteroides abscessus]MBN7437125.1 hypothetical protein [Mycobacteroides abscessus subsp. abscessus]MDM1887784.1 hypothetical protein [Mycobacteroides abscessus]MDM1892295.1 hypothetical protein [Mycobacteroides abscessus]SHQ63477.1 Uncharacterised protein [Mycobacteroides abscessus subsp. abscessus]SHS12871.1 Uncharacterised protein [Mycobacteroides abscessus subsp. abscessus]